MTALRVRVPQQHNMYDCGFYLFMCARHPSPCHPQPPPVASPRAQQLRALRASAQLRAPAQLRRPLLGTQPSSVVLRFAQKLVANLGALNELRADSKWQRGEES